MSKNETKLPDKKGRSRNKDEVYLFWIVRIYVVFILAIYPLYVGPEKYHNIIFRKAQLYWCVSAAFVIAFTLFYLVYILGKGKIYNEKKIWQRLGIPDWAALAFLAIVTISCGLSEYQDIVWLGAKNRNDGWLTMFFMITAYFIISRWYRPSQIDFTLFAASIFIFCAIGILQFYGHDIFNLFPFNSPSFTDKNGFPIHSGFTINFRSTIGNIDFVSAYVCMAVLASTALYVKSREKIRFFYCAVSISSFIFMIMAGADAGKMGVLAAVLLLLPFWMSDKVSFGKLMTQISLWGLTYAAHHWVMVNIIMADWVNEPPLRNYRMKMNYHHLPLTPVIIISVLGIILGILLVYSKYTLWIKPAKVSIIGACLLLTTIAGGLLGVELVGGKLPEKNIIYQAREIMHGNMEDSFGSNRGFVWKRAVDRIQYLPIFGTGSDTFISAFGKINQADAIKLHRVSYDKAHNDFIQIAACNGLFGLLAYLTLVVSLTIMAIKKISGDIFLFVSLGVVLAYLGQSFFGIDTLTVTPIFWMMLGVARQRELVLETPESLTANP